MKRPVSTRELRQRIGPLLDQVAAGAQLVVTRRGLPIARVVPEIPGASAKADYPLEGSVLSMSPDFDAPMEDQEPGSPPFTATRNSVAP